MDAGFFWSDGWSWNGSMVLGWWLQVAVATLAFFVILALILFIASGVALVRRRRSSSGSARTLSRSNT